MKKFMFSVAVFFNLYTATNADTEVKYRPSETLAVAEEYFESERRIKLINAIIKVESNNNELAFNPSELAAGVLQIRPIMIREVNRLVGYNKYSLKDRWNRDKSIEIFTDYQNTLNPEWNAKKAARLWNGGYYGCNKKATLSYWFKVKHNFNDKVNKFRFNDKEYCQI